MHKKILNFIFELGMLKQIKHEGWRLIGIRDPESVGEHSLRTAQIAYLLAKLEKHPKPEEICTMAVFHDIGECRIGDLHKVASGYTEANEEQAVRDQLENLGKAGDEILEMWQQVEEKDSKAGIIAKDADLLEQAITAKEYKEIGHKKAQDWIDNVKKHLKTKSAKKLLKLLNKSNPQEWWKNLKVLSK